MQRVQHDGCQNVLARVSFILGRKYTQFKAEAFLACQLCKLCRWYTIKKSSFHLCCIQINHETSSKGLVYVDHLYSHWCISFKMHAEPTQTPTKPNFIVLQRKNWHLSLHSKTWSHNSQSHTHKLMHFHTLRSLENINSHSALRHFVINIIYLSIYVYIHHCRSCFMSLVIPHCLHLFPQSQ